MCEPSRNEEEIEKALVEPAKKEEPSDNLISNETGSFFSDGFNPAKSKNSNKRSSEANIGL